MPRFSEQSLERLRTCDPLLQTLFIEVVQGMDCAVLEGFRGEARQREMLAQGRTKLGWPESRHNTSPSRAVDVAPYPIDWAEDGVPRERGKALARFYHFAGYVLAVADAQGIGVRWGGDWDGDHEFRDQIFDDLVHFELLDE